MQKLIERIRRETPANFDFEWLGRFVRSIDLPSLDLAGSVPEYERESGNYARNILLMEPFEVVVLHWPPGVASAIHHHEGFWGYVLCMEGELENVEYTFDVERKELRERGALEVRKGGVLPEPDGTIHKIANPSSDQSLISIHFYAPALDTLDGMVLFDAEKGWRGELNAQASTASFHQDPRGFRKLEKDAFTFIPLSETAGHRTHRLYPVIPKPSAEEILRGIEAYYSEQADQYDELDGESEKRRAYTEGINRIIAADLRRHPPLHLLDIACGTGRRATQIRDDSGLDYRIDGVDISASMVEQARSRGVDARIGIWNECQVSDAHYDAISLLYAFGHIPNVAERKKSLLKVLEALKPGGRFYFDVFNVDNPNEWGPEALRLFEQLDLEMEGYESGDLFYRRHQGRSMAFLHYCRRDGITGLVESCGFRVVAVHRIGYVDRPGQLLSADERGGNLLLVIEKPA